jgi:hypothetical protein
MPCTRSLLKTIDSLLKMTQIARKSRVLKTWRLPHIHFFLKNTIEKSILNI